MYILDESSDDISSSTVDFSISVCGRKKNSSRSAKSRRRKRSVDPERDTSFVVELPMQQTFPLIHVNETPSAYDTMFHNFTVTNLRTPVLINVYPNDSNATYEILIKNGGQPMSDDYDFRFVLPTNESLTSNVSEEHKYDLDRTIFIARENLTNGTYQAGVKFYGKARCPIFFYFHIKCPLSIT